MMSTRSPSVWPSTSEKGARPGSGSSTPRGPRRPVERPESPSTIWSGANPEYDSTDLRYEYTSLVTPRSVYDLDLPTGRSTLRKRQPVLGEFRTDRYRTERVWSQADAGARVPISLVYRHDLVDRPDDAGPSGGGAPCLLYGYGSYEASMDPDLLVATTEPARPGLHVRHRPRPRRR